MPMWSALAGIFGIPGRLQSEPVAGFDRNPWPQSSESAARAVHTPPHEAFLRPTAPCCPLDEPETSRRPVDPFLGTSSACPRDVVMPDGLCPRDIRAVFA